ncbi:MAG: Hsp33 family molecular chaperone HslO [Pseudomonadota bacterium]
MNQVDSAQNFIFHKQALRGMIVHLNESYNTIIQQHHYPEVIHKRLGEMLLATTMLSSALKYQGQVTLQIQTQSQLKLMVAKCSHDLNIRGLAQFNEDSLSMDLNDDFNRGELIVTIENSETQKNYQSMIAIEQQEVAQMLESYFDQSVQLPTYVVIHARENAVSGMLLQTMPDVQAEQNDLAENDLVQELTARMYHLNQSDFQLTNADLLDKLYSDQAIDLYPPTAIKFSCPCSIERMEEAVRMLGKAEIDDILAKNKTVSVTCEFCNYIYEFDKYAVLEIFSTPENEGTTVGN